METPKILFLTNSEMGQASVALAVAHELLLRPGLSIHIASFAPLSTAVTSLNARAALLASCDRAATFHLITGPTMKAAYGEKTGYPNTFNIHRVGFRGALKAYKNVLPTIVAPWDGAQYMTTYNECVELIKQLQPVIAVVDPLFFQAIDACRMVELQYVVLSPNTFKDHVPQPKLASLWKYSIMCSGYPYPLPWWLVIPNAFLAVRAAKAFKTAPKLRELEQYRNDNGVVGPMPSTNIQPDDKTPFLLPGTPEIEFPCFIPDNFTLCGPIIRPWASISQEHPELAKWLTRRPTLVVNLGSHVCVDNAMKRQLAEGLRILLEKRPDMQILWKLKQDPDEVADPNALRSLETAIKEDKIRFETWLPVEPMCVLLSGRVECIVHHGGSNTYHEAIKAGIPQVVIPVWFDQYDFAARVEWLGIGAWAKSKHAPAFKGEDLAKALTRVLASNETDRIEENAKKLAAQLGSVEGRVVACEKILQIISPTTHEQAESSHVEEEEVNEN